MPQAIPDDVDRAALRGLLTSPLEVTNNGPSGATMVSAPDSRPAARDRQRHGQHRLDLGGRVRRALALLAAPLVLLAAAPAEAQMQVESGTYTGDDNDNRDFTGIGFWPEWVVVSRSSNAAGSQASPPVHKPASSGVGVDSSLLFDSTDAENDDIQELQPDGFQLGKRVPVNGNVAPDTYYWVAFGPHEPQTNLRSIGTAPAYGTSTVGVTTGSTFVSGTGTAWLTANRGRGDVLTVPCPIPPACIGGVNPSRCRCPEPVR